MWGGLGESLESIRSPQTDVIDRDKDILMRIEVPGLEKKNIDVSASNGALNIKGSLQRESKEQRKGYFRRPGADVMNEKKHLCRGRRRCRLPERGAGGGQTVAIGFGEHGHSDLDPPIFVAYRVGPCTAVLWRDGLPGFEIDIESVHWTLHMIAIDHALR